MDVQMEIGGRALVMRYTVNSMCVVEEIAGGSLSEAFNSDFTAVRLLLWGALIDRQQGITLREVGELLDAHLRGAARWAKLSTPAPRPCAVRASLRKMANGGHAGANMNNCLRVWPRWALRMREDCLHARRAKSNGKCARWRRGRPAAPRRFPAWPG